jgi:hypothetical protein
MQTRGSTGNQLGWFNLAFEVRSSSNVPLFSASPIITPDSQPVTEGAFLPRPKAANSGVCKNFLSWSRQQRSRISFLAKRSVFRCNRQKFRWQISRCVFLDASTRGHGCGRLHVGHIWGRTQNHRVNSLIIAKSFSSEFSTLLRHQENSGSHTARCHFERYL